MGFEGFSAKPDRSEEEAPDSEGVIPELETTLEGLTARETGAETLVQPPEDIFEDLTLNPQQEAALKETISRLIQEKE